MQKKYTLLIDESGDQGLDRVMTHENPFGASSYLTMGAALVPTILCDQYRQTLGEISEKLRLSQLHCTDMNHPQVAYFSRELSKLRILCFGVVLKKSTLGSYREMIAGEDQAHDYYNKCSQYLLELVGAYAGSKGISSTDISIVFERKRGHDYGRLGRYLKAISDKPIHPKAAKLSYLSPFAISAMTKDEEPLLAIADNVAYALHKAFCSENNRLNITEQRYLRELKAKFCSCEKTSKIANFGVKFIKGPIAMGFSGGDLKFALKFYQEHE